MYIAHINEKNGLQQSVCEHCKNTARLAEKFAIPELRELCYVAGLIHDIEKFCKRFQDKMAGESIRVDHSTAGAVAAFEQYPEFIAYLLSLCIAGHHSGIPDSGRGERHKADYSSTLYARIRQKKKRCESDAGEAFDTYKDEIELPPIDIKKLDAFIKADCENCKTNEEFQRFLTDKVAFITRQIYSCLVDADSIDTGRFCETRTEDSLHMNFENCLNKVNEKLESFTCETPLQRARNSLQAQVFEKVNEDAEIYLMNMPTGSGKTLCSIKFALERLIKKGKKHIIYVIPYNSIIDQTVYEFEKIFGEDCEILRHQSSFSYEDAEDIDEDYRNAIKNGTENWDAPLIVTTAVQFFESIHSNKRNKLRKLHNMADAVIVFDEAHLMPTEYLQACLQAVAFTTRYLNSEAILLTATMPNFRSLMEKYALKGSKILDLIDDIEDFAKFDKCKFVNAGEISNEKLLEMAEAAPSALVVTNTKKTAKELYQNAGGQKFYLSTYLTALDRQRIIGEIKEALYKLEKDFPDLENVPESRRIKIFSTSLIEAGVDIDVHTVFRERTGLDSVLQSGGRCNRERKRKAAVTYVFDFEESVGGTKTQEADLTLGMFAKYENIAEPACIREYYQRLLKSRENDIISRTMSSFYYNRTGAYNFCDIPFRTYAENFHFIQESTVSIVIARDAESRTLVNALQFQEYVNHRKLQKYTCSISKQELEELKKHGVVNDYDRGVWCLTNENYYDERLGIGFEFTDYFL